MLLSTSTLGYQKGGRFKEAISMLAAAGFDAYDMSFRVMEQVESCAFNGDGYLELAKELRALADSLGIVCNQAHAPFPSSYADPEKNARVYEKIVRSMEIASILGAKYIVVHPQEHMSFTSHKEELFNSNVEFYKSLIPYCKKYGLKVAVENIWQREPYDGTKRVIGRGVTSLKEDFSRLVFALPEEYFVACLDIGHIVLVHENITEMVRALGHDRLKLIHAHDNWIADDDHSVPLLGKIPYDEVIAALKEIDYDGDFTFEAIAFESRFPFEVKPAVARFLNDIGRHLIEMFND